MTPEQMRDASLLELFSLEAEAQTQVLSAGLMALERNTQADQLEACMRAAHSLKGAARIVGMDAGVSVAHVMEDCLVAPRKAACCCARAYRRAAARHRPADAHRHAGRSGRRTWCRCSRADGQPARPAAVGHAWSRRRCRCNAASHGAPPPVGRRTGVEPEPSRPCGARPASAVAKVASGCCGSPPTA
jgi:HPt (histidine-containing phosphotransfer) domain-containing protein